MNEPYYVNVFVGSEDHNGDMNPYGCVCYKFSTWEEASSFIKISLDNGLIVGARIPADAKDEQVV